jgi:phosphatidate phosphatase APP1
MNDLPDDTRRALASVETDAEALAGWAAIRRDAAPLQIVPYDGFGTPAALRLGGRVLMSAGARPATADDSLWRNLANMYRRFATVEVPGARVRAGAGGAAAEAIADREGYFAVRLAPPALPAPSQLWQPVLLELLDPPAPAGAVRATGHVLVPPPGARFGVISDIDDTVIQTDVRHAVRMAVRTFTTNARTRLPFIGVAALYRALHAAAPPPAINPIFYVSAGPWNLYDLLTDLFAYRQIPRGPLLLRDWGLAGDKAGPNDTRAHKRRSIDSILRCYPRLPFLLIGDSGQHDPEIYAEAAEAWPGRIATIYIRDVARSPRRAGSLAAAAARAAAVGSPMVVAATTMDIARDAAARGWLPPAALAEVAAGHDRDAQRPVP